MRTATFALFAGFAYISAGILGLVPAALQSPPGDVPAIKLPVLYGDLLGVFPVNIIHSGVHLAIGAAGIYAWRSDHVWRRMATPKIYARALALVYAVLAVFGVTPGLKTLFGLAPLYGNDVWLHAATAAIAAYFGWRAEAFVDRRNGALDRREAVNPVKVERRLGHADRRDPGSEV